MIRIVLAIALFLATTSFAAKQTTENSKEHTKWIASVIDSIPTMKPGMTAKSC